MAAHYHPPNKDRFDESNDNNPTSTDVSDGGSRGGGSRDVLATPTGEASVDVGSAAPTSTNSSASLVLFQSLQRFITDLNLPPLAGVPLLLLIIAVKGLYSLLVTTPRDFIGRVVEHHASCHRLLNHEMPEKERGLRRRCRELGTEQGGIREEVDDLTRRVEAMERRRLARKEAERGFADGGNTTANCSGGAALAALEKRADLSSSPPFVAGDAACSSNADVVPGPAGKTVTVRRGKRSR